MKPDDALTHCQAYLDGELDPALTAEVEACLASNPDIAEFFEQERTFLAFLKTRSARVDTSPNLIDGIKSRLQQEQAQHGTAPAPLKMPTQRFSRRGFLAIAAGIAIVASVAFYKFGRSPECPYMVSCADEFADIKSGKSPALIQSQDRSKLAAFVDEKLALKLREVPELNAFKLNADGAGISTFESLKSEGSPDAAFVSYKSASGEIATLFIHPWANVEPEAFNKTQFQGNVFWAATHHKQSMAVWQSDDGKMLMSIVTNRSKEETLQIANTARRAFSVQLARLAVRHDVASND